MNQRKPMVKHSLSVRQIRFQFAGQPISETDTPVQPEAEDADMTDVFQ